MALAPATRLGSYEIAEPIGKGGMGEVYRARDTKLDRDVAIKVLPEEFAADEERLARFEREAKLLASLNHPNIASIHGFEESDGVKALVLELVEGPTLAERIEQGPIPVDEAIAIAKQIAEALEAGHEAGVIHRDLKPANIKVKEDGTVKVLDYGLAKALEGEASVDSDSELSHSPTLTRQGTQIGVILGTAAYMSPEQAKGKKVDKRTDIWAFGAVAYEMLTGKRAFGGEDVSDTLASVLRGEIDWAEIPESTPASLRRVLERSLIRESKNRLHDIADARIELSAPTDTSETSRGSQSRLWQLSFVATVAALLGAGITTMLRGTGNEPPREPQRFVVPGPREEPRLELSNPVISRDGLRVVYIGSAATNFGRSNTGNPLYLRELSEQESRELPGTTGAIAPFFSPDGLWVGFIAGGKLQKVSVRGGAPVEVAVASSNSPGGQWAPDGSIWFSPTWLSGFVKVPADGGELTEITTPDASRGERGHWWPDFLPDGRTVLFTIATNEGYENNRVGALDTTTGMWRALFQGSAARYAPSGHIIYYRSGIYRAAPFDLSTLERTGPAVPVLKGTRALHTFGSMQTFHSFSGGGILVSVPGKAFLPTSELSWVHLDGTLEALSFESAAYEDARVSPDGRRVAVTRISEGMNKIWLYDLHSGAAEMFPTDSTVHNPRWTADGGRLIYGSGRRGVLDVLSKSMDAFGSEEVLLADDTDHGMSVLSPDGKWLAVELYPPGMGGDLALVELGAGSAPETVVTSPFTDGFASFSRDNAWMAFTSNASGRLEIYVQPVQGERASVKVSNNGGEFSVWSPTRDELYYQRGNTILGVPYGVAGQVFQLGVPFALFEMPDGSVLRDISRDGERFLILTPTGEDLPSTELHVVVNWFEELKRLVPTED